MCHRQICRVVLSVFVIPCISCVLWRWLVCFYIGPYVVSSLFAAGYAFDFCGDPRLVEACRREFAGDMLFL